MSTNTLLFQFFHFIQFVAYFSYTFGKLIQQGAGPNVFYLRAQSIILLYLKMIGTWGDLQSSWLWGVDRRIGFVLVELIFMFANLAKWKPLTLSF